MSHDGGIRKSQRDFDGPSKLVADVQLTDDGQFACVYLTDGGGVSWQASTIRNRWGDLETLNLGIEGEAQIGNLARALRWVADEIDRLSQKVLGGGE